MKIPRRLASIPAALIASLIARSYRHSDYITMGICIISLILIGLIYIGND